jgi:thiamine monophosphate synthase
MDVLKPWVTIVQLKHKNKHTKNQLQKITKSAPATISFDMGVIIIGIHDFTN